MQRRERGHAPLDSLAGWALGASDNGWAVVSGARVVGANAAFTALGRTRRSWTMAQGPSRARPRRPSSLGDVVVAAAAELPKDGPRTIRRRLGCGSHSYDLVLERLLTSDRARYTLALIHPADGAAPPPSALAGYDQIRALGELALGVAHDVKNVLGAMDLRLGILAQDPDCRAAQGSNIEALRRILREGSGLLSRLQAIGQGPAERVGPVALDEIILSAVEVAGSGLRLRARQTGVDLRIVCELGQIPAVRGLVEDLRHVFINLLINARDAMPRGGQIRISSKVEPTAVVVRVEDEGSGIAPEGLARIFDPFFTTKGGGGSGLGLTLARNVVTQLGGEIRAFNRAAGGACFELRFLRADDPASRRRARHAPSGGRVQKSTIERQ